MNSPILLIRSELNNLDTRTDIDRVKFKLYGIYVDLLLSRKIFAHNEDIKPFCEQNDLKFKDYVYRSRTLLVSRVIRSIEKADMQTLILYKKNAEKITEKLVSNREANKKQDPIQPSVNFIDKYGRS